MKSSPMKTLLIEHNPADARLIERALTEARGASFDLEWVDNLSSGLKRLSSGKVDIVLLDLAGSSDLELDALAQVHGAAAGVPIIVLTGSYDKEWAVQVLRLGAQDYLVKDQLDTDSLVRTMRYAMERMRIEQELRASEEKYRLLAENAHEAVLVIQDGILRFVNAKASEVSGYSRDEFISRPFAEFIHPDDREMLLDRYLRRLAGETLSYPYAFRLINKDGGITWVEMNSALITWEHKPGLLVFLVNITDRRKAEERLQRRLEFEKQVSTIATHFLNVSAEEIDDAIRDALQRTGELERADRSYLFLFSEDETRMDNTHEWCAEGIERQVSNLQGIPLEAFPWWTERIRRLEAIHVPRVTDLPPEANAEKEILQAQDIQSLVAVPLVSGNRPIGFLGFDSVERERSWPEEDIELLKVVAQVLASALARKQSDEALRLSENRYRTLVEQSADGIYLVDIKTKRVLESNLALQHMLGYSSEELVGISLYDLVFADREDIDRRFQHVLDLKGNQPFTHERKYRRKDGSLVDVWTTGSTIFYRDGEIMCSLVRDISEQKRSQQILRESEARYRAVMEQSPDGIYLVDVESKRIMEGNSAFQRLLGYTYPEILRLSLPDFVVADRDEMEQRFMDVLTGKGPFTFERTYRRKDGFLLEVWVSTSVISFGGRKVVLILVRDLTELNQAQKALQASEARYRAVMEQSPDGIYLVDVESKRLLEANPAFAKMLGYTAEEIQGLTPYDFTAADRENIEERFSMVTTSQYPLVYERQFHRKDGSQLEAWVNANVITFAGRKVACFIIRDLTERKQAEEALRESEARYRAVMEQSVDGIFLVDVGSRQILESNGAFHKMIGYTSEEMLKLSLYDIVAANREDVDRKFSQIVSLKDSHAYEREYRRRDGSLFDVWVSGNLITYGGKQVVCVIVRDLTDRKRMEQELLKADKLESLSTLAGGIAHDFNNLLTTVLSNLSLATSQLGSQDPLGQKLEEAERACLQTRGLTYQLLTFSKGGAPVRRVMSLPSLVKEAARFALVGSKASCEFLLPEDLWPANIDETQIGQVIHNLLLNADQAMPKGGKIHIEARNVTIQGHTLFPLSDGRYVTVSIRDEGLGIPPERLPRIFDPFFTTKPGASGLGLSTSYSILKNHGGYLTVTSEMDKGSAFTFYLPVSSQGEEERGEESKPQEEVPIRGKGRILVMDDQEGVRLAAKHALSHLGYEPTLAKNGAEAIQLYREAWESGLPFAAVIMDLTVPAGMGGHEALQQMVQIHPQVKAILCSGYAPDPILSHYQEHGFLGVLSKPYRIEEMGRILQEVIEGKGKGEGA